ncbi:MAG TPA: YncE family protein, partial [Acetobacteraceae bacterium]|nr:YncE family protein [Acetobacteraceae bacterium]
MYSARLVLVLLSLLGPFPAIAAGLAFVMNSGGASISLLDMSAQKELRRVPALREPHHWALTPDKRSLIVGDSSANELLFLDPATGALQLRLAVADPYQLGFSPDGKVLVVNGLARNQVDVYSLPDYKLVKRFPLRSMPSHLAFAPDSGRVFVSLQGSNRLAAIDLRKLDIIWDKPVGNTPAGVLWHDGRLLVADMGTDYLAEVDPADGRVLRHIVTGKGAHNLFLSPDGKTIWVNNRVAGTITVLGANELTTQRVYRISGGPD